MLLNPFYSSFLDRRKVSRNSLNKGDVEYIGTPFKVIILKNVLRKDAVRKLSDEVSTLSFHEKASDLFRLAQSEDFKGFNFKKHPQCKQIMQLFQEQIKPLIEILLQVKLTGNMSMSAARYSDSDYLLCHDDRCDDRRVAFIYYLTEEWDTSFGGLFEMFSHTANGHPLKVVRSILPEFNTLLCFPVSTLSFHQVSEVVVPNMRLTISGWFHSPEALEIDKRRRPRLEQPMEFKRIRCNYLDPSEFEYLQMDIGYYVENASDMSTAFCNEGSILLKNVIRQNLFNAATEELKSNYVKWTVSGPPDRRHYHVAQLNDTPKNRVPGCKALSTLLHFFQQLTFLAVLDNCTLLGLAEALSTKAALQFDLEVIRWSSGSYSLLVDEQNHDHKSSLDVWLFFNCDNVDTDVCGGNLTYVYTSPHQNGDLEDDVVTFQPVNNSAFIVASYKGKLPFVQYIDHRLVEDYYAIRVRYLINFSREDLTENLLKSARNE